MEQHNLYFEVPGAGGGNEPFANRASALREARSIAKSYPDAYVQVTRRSDHAVAFTHDGASVA